MVSASRTQKFRRIAGAHGNQWCMLPITTGTVRTTPVVSFRFRMRISRARAAFSWSAGEASSSTSSGSYPASRMTRRRSPVVAMAGTNSIVAALVAKFTAAEMTPGASVSAVSIVATQDAQEMPLMGMVIFSTAGVKPASATARTRAAGVAAAGSYWTLPRSAARFTAACRTPGTAASARSTAATHEAQLIPPTPTSRRRVFAGAAAWTMRATPYALPAGFPPPAGTPR